MERGSFLRWGLFGTFVVATGKAPIPSLYMSWRAFASGRTGPLSRHASGSWVPSGKSKSLNRRIFARAWQMVFLQCQRGRGRVDGSGAWTTRCRLSAGVQNYLAHRATKLPRLAAHRERSDACVCRITGPSETRPSRMSATKTCGDAAPAPPPARREPGPSSSSEVSPPNARNRLNALGADRPRRNRGLDVGAECQQQGAGVLQVRPTSPQHRPDVTHDIDEPREVLAGRIGLGKGVDNSGPRQLRRRKPSIPHLGCV